MTQKHYTLILTKKSCRVVGLFKVAPIKLQVDDLIKMQFVEFKRARFISIETTVPQVWKTAKVIEKLSGRSILQHI
jgi:hypothetical protein